VFDFVGLKQVAEQGLAMLGVGGGLYLVGVAKPEVGLEVNIFDAIGGQKRIQGVNFGSTNFKRDIPIFAALYLQGRLNLDDLVSKRIALRGVNEGYAARSRKVRSTGSSSRLSDSPFVEECDERASRYRFGQDDHDALH
jgi:S-(hydroxymethyl)glutathione dehydrogenase/alcohol dehydrogenase